MPAEPPVDSPTTLEDAYALLASAPYRPIAGGTDVMVQLTGELIRPPERLLDLWRIDDLRGMTLERGNLVLGALTTYTEIRRSALCKALTPTLVEAAATIGAIQIQNRGTLGGNIVNASPAGDTLPVLLAMDAEIVLGSVRGERVVSASEFWTGYRQTARAEDELVLRVRFPIIPEQEVRFRKVGTRRAQAISKVVLALAWRIEPASAGAGRAGSGRGAGGVGVRPAWREVRLALGSVADRPIRALRTEAVLEGSLPTDRIAELAAASVAEEISPIDDVRSTAEYRRNVTARVLRRLVRDEGGW
jgi:carbon-monoxide dehydrogenase medium subunit